MTDLERLVAELERDPAASQRFGAELLHARRVIALCKRMRRRLPYQVVRALDAPARPTELDPPPEANTAPGLFSPTTD